MPQARYIHTPHQHGTRLHQYETLRRGQPYLIDLLVRHGSLVGNVLPCDLGVQIRFDAAWSDGVDCDTLAAEVCAGFQERCTGWEKAREREEKEEENSPTARHLANASTAPLLPEYTLWLATPLAEALILLSMTCKDGGVSSASNLKL